MHHRQRIPLFLMILGIMVSQNNGESKEILKIGAIFSTEDTLEELALRLAVDTINNDSTLLPNYELQYISSYIGILSTFRPIQKVCYQLTQAVTAIIGPLSSSSVKSSYPMCQGFHVPMIAPGATDPTLGSQQVYKYLIRMMPSDAQQSRALVDFMAYFRWDTVAILTDNTDYGINGLLQFQADASANKWRILSVQMFSASSNASDTDAREALRIIKGTGARVVILNCLSAHAVYVLEQAHGEGMMGAGYVWVVTDGVTGYNALPNLLSERPYLSGIVGTRPSSTSGALYDAFTRKWLDMLNQTASGNTYKEPLTWPLAYYDSVLVYAHAMHHLLEQDGGKLKPKVNRCNQVPAQYWKDGDTVHDYLREVTTDGVMRFLEFGSDGSPLDAAYDIVTLGNGLWEKRGQWTDNKGLTLNVTGLQGQGGKLLYDVRDYVGDLVNKTLKVSTVLDAPFVFKTNISEARDDAVCGPDGSCFYGYAIDLLETLSKELKFSYVIREVPDGKYGRRDDVTKQWNGLVNMLIPGKNKHMADLGVGAITISSERQSVISFTKPYRDLQLGILLGSPEEQTYNPWSFLTPLSYELWGFIIGTAFVVGIFITCIDKLSPYGHYGAKAQIDGEHEHNAMDINEDGSVDYWEEKDWYAEKHRMSVTNATLWTLASLFQQGGERHPNSWSARIAAGAWWFGVLIITASYTANLAAFLTIKNSADEISTIEDLMSSTSMTYGTVRDSQVQEFFDTAQREPYKTIADRMRKWDSNFDDTESIVRHTIDSDGQFAMLYDLPGIYYWKGQDCRLKMAKNGYANIGYGFALPKDSAYTEELTLQIYQLREAGYMDTLDEKWLVKTALCSEHGGSAEIDDKMVMVGMPSLWGVFWIMYAGFGISIFFVAVEWFVSAASAVDNKHDKAPRTFLESVKQRFKVLKNDFLENWFINFHHKEIKQKEQAMRPLPPAVRAAILFKIKSVRIRSQNSASVNDPDEKQNNATEVHKPNAAENYSNGDVLSNDTMDSAEQNSNHVLP